VATVIAKDNRGVILGVGRIPDPTNELLMAFAEEFGAFSIDVHMADDDEYLIQEDNDEYWTDSTYSQRSN
jgi:hypothetical protein